MFVVCFLVVLAPLGPATDVAVSQSGLVVVLVVMDTDVARRLPTLPPALSSFSEESDEDSPEKGVLRIWVAFWKRNKIKGKGRLESSLRSKLLTTS